MSELHERVAKLEVQVENHAERIEDHDDLMSKIDKDISELRAEINEKMDNAVIKALDAVPAWFGKMLTGIVAFCTAVIAWLTFRH